MASVNQFDGILMFLAVAEQLSFTKASATLGVTPMAVSKSIRTLEQRHGVVLFQRTTRQVNLTEAGLSLQRHLRPIVADIEHAFDTLHGFRDRPTGTLRLTMSRLALTALVEPMIEQFRIECPDVRLDLSISEGLDDLVDGNFDAGFRLGESVERDMVAVRMTPAMGWSVAASPAYFQLNGRPKVPEDLISHEAILYRFPTSGAIYQWEFQRGKRSFTVDVPGPLIVSDRSALIRLARQGLGLAYVSDLEASGDFASGALVSVLREYIANSAGLFLYFPARSQTQPKLRAFIDCARQYLDAKASLPNLA